MDLDDIADQLYGLVPSSFVAVRRDRAAAAKAAGDRELADAVTKLPRPTVAAWLVNLLVHAEPEQVAGLLELGPAFRDAHTAGSGDALRRLSARRNTLVAALTQQAANLAAAAGQQVRDDARRAVADTLEAALADPAAADAVRSGRLTRTLQYAGLGPVEITDVVAVPVRVGRRPATPHREPPGAPAEPGAASAAGPTTGTARGDSATPPATEARFGGRSTRPGRAAPSTSEPATADRDQHVEQERAERRRHAERRAAERAREHQSQAARRELADAEEMLAAAQRRANERESALFDARRALADSRRRIDELTAQLEQARMAARADETVADQAQQELTEATAAASEAHQRRSAAQAALSRLEKPRAPQDSL